MLGLKIVRRWCFDLMQRPHDEAWAKRGRGCLRLAMWRGVQQVRGMMVLVLALNEIALVVFRSVYPNQYITKYHEELVA